MHNGKVKNTSDMITQENQWNCLILRTWGGFDLNNPLGNKFTK